MLLMLLLDLRMLLTRRLRLLRLNAPHLILDMPTLEANPLRLPHSRAIGHGLWLIQKPTAMAASFYAFKHITPKN